MILYTCNGKDKNPALHPCGKAAKALADAGHAVDITPLGGARMIPFSRRGKRDAVEQLTGSPNVPVLVLADGTAIGGSGKIVDWARANPA